MKPVLKKILFQFSAKELPTLQEQLKRQEEKVRAAAPDQAHVGKLTNIVTKAQTGTDRELCFQFRFICMINLS
jgi:hypothetical protein